MFRWKGATTSITTVIKHCQGLEHVLAQKNWMVEGSVNMIGAWLILKGWFIPMIWRYIIARLPGASPLWRFVPVVQVCLEIRKTKKTIALGGKWWSTWSSIPNSWTMAKVWEHKVSSAQPLDSVVHSAWSQRRKVGIGHYIYSKRPVSKGWNLLGHG